jgi:hypothetical protein
MNDLTIPPERGFLPVGRWKPVWLQMDKMDNQNQLTDNPIIWVTGKAEATPNNAT